VGEPARRRLYEVIVTARGVQPVSTAQVVGLYTAGQAGAPMRSHLAIELMPGVGIVGDRYALHLGHWSAPRWPDQELTLVEAEVAEELAVPPGALRRNIVTRGVRLDRLIGVTFQLGNTQLVGVRRCDPCRYLDGLTRPGLGHALRGKGGLRAHIMRGGTIQPADLLVVARSI
jgi:MOSC domain-containing protein YiiM